MGVVGAAVTAGLSKGGFPAPAVGATLACLGGIAFLCWRFRKLPTDVLRCVILLPLALGRAVSPLLLATAVLALYASRAVGFAYQVAVGVLLAAVAALIVGRESQSERVPLLFVALLFLPVGALFVLLLTTPLVGGIEEFGGVSAAVEVCGLLLVLLATCCRLGAFASVSTLRRLATAALGVSALAIAFAWGFVPGGGGGEALGLTGGEWALLPLLAFFIVAFVEADAALRDMPKRQAPARAAQLFRLGFFGAVGGMVALLVALALVELTSRRTPPASATTAVRPGTPTMPPSKLTDGQLAAMFTPVLAFESAAKEAWLPERVDRFVRDAHLLDLSGGSKCVGCSTDPRVRDLPIACTTGAESCFLLSCGAGDGQCAEKHARVDERRTAVYARVVRRSEDPRAFLGVTPDHWRVSIIVQYWLWYPYNRWKAFTPFGYLTQEHEGDWESITIGLSDRRPLFVAYSAHCGGSWHRWEEIEVLDVVEGRIDERASTGLHPLVAVATGSHANYLGAWRGRPPDWGSCRRLPSEATWALTYASNVRDRTGSERRIYPAFVDLVGESDPVMSFAGRWGRSEVTSIEAFERTPIGKPRQGPESPALKDIWRRPVAIIFCTRHWLPRLDCGGSAE
jgi:hypothetical protein